MPDDHAILMSTLIRLFERIGCREPALIRALSCAEESFTLEAGRWYFTLPDLHKFVQRQEPIFRVMDYTRFRRLLMSCPINQRLTKTGARIVIARNLGHVDHSTYAMVWENAP